MALRWIPLLDENGDILLDENGDPILVLADTTVLEGGSGRSGAPEKPKPDPRLWEIYQEEAARLWKPKPKKPEPELESDTELETEPAPDLEAIARAAAEAAAQAARLKRQRDQEQLSKLLRKAARR